MPMNLLTATEIIPQPDLSIARPDVPPTRISRRLIPQGKSYRRLLQTLHSTKERSLYLTRIDMKDLIEPV